MLGAEIDRLGSVNTRLEGSIEDHRLQLADMQTLEKHLQEQLALMVVLFAEIESLRTQLAARERELLDSRNGNMTSYRM